MVGKLSRRCKQSNGLAEIDSMDAVLGSQLVYFWVKVCLSRFLRQMGSLEGWIQDECWVIKQRGVNCLEVV